MSLILQTFCYDCYLNHKAGVDIEFCYRTICMEKRLRTTNPIPLFNTSRVKHHTNNWMMWVLSI